MDRSTGKINSKANLGNWVGRVRTRKSVSCLDGLENEAGTRRDETSAPVTRRTTVTGRYIKTIANDTVFLSHSIYLFLHFLFIHLYTLNFLKISIKFYIYF